MERCMALAGLRAIPRDERREPTTFPAFQRIDRQVDHQATCLRIGARQAS